MHEEMIPITMFIMTGLAVMAFFIISYFKRKLQSQEIIAAIEHGADVPFPEPRQKSYLLPGVIWTLIGLISAIAMLVSTPSQIPAGVWVWGLLPCAVGVGYLVAFYFQQKEKAEEEAKESLPEKV